MRSTGPAALGAQPSQLANGPGGAPLACSGILAQHVGPPSDGTTERSGYWLFEPTRPRTPTASGSLPLVLFLHGFDFVGPESHHA
ncbi:MAG: hypothetical protein U0Z70_00920 [Thermomicrobiales bacterium]